MLPVRESGEPWEGGTARESKNETTRKRESSALRECLRKARRPASAKWNASAAGAG